MSRNILILRQIYDKIYVYPEMSNKQILDQDSYTKKDVRGRQGLFYKKSNYCNTQIAW